jgi:hypothetical protein
MKVGRNDPCPCGSGKKYKKCCIDKGITVQDTRIDLTNRSLPAIDKSRTHRDTGERQLLKTTTGEIYQPIRIHYELFNKDEVIKVFSKLRCMDYDEENNRWVWLYDKEAKSINLGKASSFVQKKDGTIVLGSFHIRTDREMFLDLRSFERATAAIVFFDEYIKRDDARAKYVDVVNRLFDATDGFAPSLDIFFDRNDINLDAVKISDEFSELASKKEKLDKEQTEALLSSFYEKSKEHYPELERLPVNYYDDNDNIGSLEFILRMRQAVALEHFLGNKDFTSADLIKQMLRGRPQDEP